MYKYCHGGNAIFEKGNENIIDLSANINPLGLSRNVAEAIICEIPNITRYPDNFSTLLREKTAVYENVNPNWLMFGNGASDIIFRLPRVVGAKKIMLCAPIFADYERSALSYGAQVVRYTLNKADKLKLDYDFIEAVQAEKPNLVYICNPNNPTGCLTEFDLIKRLLDSCKEVGSWLVVDECFMDFCVRADEYTSKPLLRDYPNLIIIKAFTKTFALPGVRLGYAICADEDIIRRLYFHGADWSVSNLSQAAGLAALDESENYMKRSVEYAAKERAIMEKTLDLLGFTTFESAANYVFFQNPFPLDLCKELDKMGIRIRPCSNYHGLDDMYYRVAVSTKNNNTKFLDAIGTVLRRYSHINEVTEC